MNRDASLPEECTVVTATSHPSGSSNLASPRAEVRTVFARTSGSGEIVPTGRFVLFPGDGFGLLARDVLPLLEGEGWGEVWSISGKVTHLTLSLSRRRGDPRQNPNDSA
jgi:hypothetical protein